MDYDALLLARLQFAFTIAFHIIFPSFTIGLASFLAVLEGLWLATRRGVFRNLYLFWIRVFAISFGMGVVSGVVMSYQLGTNWAEFSRVASPVIGPLLAQQTPKPPQRRQAHPPTRHVKAMQRNARIAQQRAVFAFVHQGNYPVLVGRVTGA